jgi:hypothetical protein
MLLVALKARYNTPLMPITAFFLKVLDGVSELMSTGSKCSSAFEASSVFNATLVYIDAAMGL